MYRGTEAYEAGLQPGDVIIVFNGQPVSDPSQLQRMVLDAKIGSMATVTVLRDGKKLQFKLPIVSSSNARVRP
jgi:S1-C subfamily serine protease